MPTYEYSCPRCGVFEVEQKMTDPKLTKCEKTVWEKNWLASRCGQPLTRLIAGGTNFVLTGKGWFKDGY